jgi:hypothetical protein
LICGRGRRPQSSRSTHRPPPDRPALAYRPGRFESHQSASRSLDVDFDFRHVRRTISCKVLQELPQRGRVTTELVGVV